MSYQRAHFVKARKPVRHARVHLHVVHCADCQRQLTATHLVYRFGNRCRGCFDALMHGAGEMVSGAEQMASHYQH